MDKNLTLLMLEKSSLHSEYERLQQRGGKTIKERSRITQIELRMNIINKEIANIRKVLSSKPL